MICGLTQCTVTAAIRGPRVLRQCYMPISPAFDSIRHAGAFQLAEKSRWDVFVGGLSGAAVVLQLQNTAGPASISLCACMLRRLGKLFVFKGHSSS